MPKLTLIAALLGIAVSGCNKTPAPRASHPPIVDLAQGGTAACPDEPAALTDEEVLADTDGSRDRAFNNDQIIAGRACRDAHARACRWHVDRGMEVPPGMRCGAAAARRR